MSFNSQAPILTTGAQAAGIVGQSIGGGGGVTGVNVTSGLSVGTPVNANLGSTGGAGGAGAGLTVTSTNWIETTGAVAPGVVAQSIGGGGGFAATSGVNSSAVVTLGSGGGAAGDAGSVTVNSASPIITSGTDSHAIVAQSIGGGGGLFLGVNASGVGVSTTVQAMTGGAGGSGGTVTVNNNAAIVTNGAGAAGIIAQSIGGGGGLVGGGEFSPLLSTSGGFAGTIGGTGSGGEVKVSTTANILTLGADSTAILAQSAGGTGQSDITVTVGSGVTVAGGTGAGHAVALYGGLRNSLSNAGTLLTEPLLSLEPQNPLLGQSAAQNAVLNTGIEEFVIVGSGGDNTVSNTGWMYGNVNLSAFGAVGYFNSFNNQTTGYFAPGNTVILGDPTGGGNRLTNAGVISPGDFYNVLTTNLTGNFTQTSTGTYLTDLDLNPNTSDRINVSGSATLSGAVELSFNNPGWARPGTSSLTILSAAGGLGGSTFASLESAPSAVFTPSLTYPNANTANLTYTINFSPTGLTSNEHSVGNGVNAIQTAGVAAFRPVAAELFFIPTVPLLGKTYNSLSGEGVSGVEQSIFSSRSQFFNSAMINASAAIAGDSGRSRSPPADRRRSGPRAGGSGCPASAVSAMTARRRASAPPRPATAAVATRSASST